MCARLRLCLLLRPASVGQQGHHLLSPLSQLTEERPPPPPRAEQPRISGEAAERERERELHGLGSSSSSSTDCVCERERGREHSKTISAACDGCHPNERTYDGQRTHTYAPPTPSLDGVRGEREREAQKTTAQGRARIITVACCCCCCWSLCGHACC